MFFSWIHESSHIKTQGFEGRLIENIGCRGGVRYFIVREWCSQQAWTERNFHTEEHRSFSSMRMLYHSANLKLQDILNQMDPLKDDPNLRALDWERLRSEAQDILYHLGCEHLSENADWLIYHRARPLEPFMAG